jgi:multidrug efflux pump subunit AcrA (membrane-fusion protein)
MTEIKQKSLTKKHGFLRSKWTIVILILVVLWLIGHFIFFKHKTVYQFVTVKNGSITQTISPTGSTTPEQSVTLSFGSSGVISNTYSSLGKKVTVGKVLAELDMADLNAQLKNAEAGLVIASQNASTGKENVTNVTAQQDALVASAWQTLHSNSTAVPKDVFTSNTAPTISGSYAGTTDGSYVIRVYASGGSGASFSYSGLESGIESVTVNTDMPLGTQGLFIRFPANVNNYINTTWSVDIPNTRWNGYANALKNYQIAIQNRDTAIANAQASIGNDNSAISNAQITQAQANVDGVRAKIQNAQIIAPISGMITQFDAKVGQLASPSMPLVSIISNNGYEVDAGVSETDIGKVSVGDTTSMTLDAFPNEVFTGKVFYIAPSETNDQGVVSYKIKISFDRPDKRLKSGLTANIDIGTKHKDNVLILPQYAILQNDQGAFVETLDANNKVKDNPVILGISDQQGNVEIISGVTLGEQVLNIGLKTK